MNNYNTRQSGFSLIELLIAMTLSLVLILGISSVFISLKGTAKDSMQLDKTQEVLRFTNSVFRQAIHRANSVTPGTYSSSDGTSHPKLDLTFDLKTDETYTDCLGESHTASTVKETYRLNNNNKQLECAEYKDAEVLDSNGQVDESKKPFESIGTGIDKLEFLGNKLLTVKVTAEGETNSVSMMFAARQMILDL